MWSLIDNFLNKITMYRLVLYILRVYIAVAVVLAIFGLLPFSPLALLFSLIFLTLIGWAVNKIFARVFALPANVESYAITGYILAIIIRPPASLHDVAFLFWAIVLAVASKFIAVFGKKHIFNPAALAVAITAAAVSQSANWWVGSAVMLPTVLIGGLLIVRKIQRFDLFFSFLVTALFSTVTFGLLRGTDPVATISKVIIDSPLIFFATVMLTEPLTTPTTREMRLYYGGLVGLLFAPQIHFGGIYSTPELALLIGNMFSFFVSPKVKLLLKLKEKIQLAPDQWDFVFALRNKINFNPGQYLEWTLPPEKMDSRGNRRYFTLASSPTEDNIRLGVKFYDNSSTFKKKLLSLSPGDEVVASQLSGEFVLDKDPGRKYVFLAGGIGITPYRSMIKYLLDTNQKRDFVLIYADKTDQELIYKDIFSQAEKRLGSKIIYVLSNIETVPQNWIGKVGYINSELIASEVPDYKERYFYISGSHSVVDALENEVKKLGVPRSQIKTDFFPGYA